MSIHIFQLTRDVAECTSRTEALTPSGTLPKVQSTISKGLVLGYLSVIRCERDWWCRRFGFGLYRKEKWVNRKKRVVHDGHLGIDNAFVSLSSHRGTTAARSS